MNIYRCTGCTEYGPCCLMTINTDKMPHGCVLEQDSSAPWKELD